MKTFPKNMALLLAVAIGLCVFDFRASRGAAPEKSAGRIVTTGNMTAARHSHTATLLPNGKVLIVGGQGNGAWGNKHSSTEIFDPAARAFAPGPNRGFERFKLLDGAVTLSDGRILIAGGADQPEVYDSAAKSFLPTAGNKLDDFYFSTTTLLHTGQVLMVGGYGHDPLAGAFNRAWLYQP